MPDAENLLDENEVRSFLSGLAFVREFSIKVVSLKPACVELVELPFDERFSGPPNLFPASMVGTAGDVAAVTSCLTLMPKGWALATLDFTIKKTASPRARCCAPRDGCCRTAAPTRSEPPTFYSVSDGTERLCGTAVGADKAGDQELDPRILQCLPRPATSRSSSLRSSCRSLAHGVTRRRTRADRHVEIIFFSIPTPAATARSYSSAPSPPASV